LLALPLSLVRHRRAELAINDKQILCLLFACNKYANTVTVWMDPFLQGVPNIATFDMQSNCTSKYKLSIKFLLQKFHYFRTLSFSCKQEDHFVDQMLTWQHWKFAYT
jgi:hypothetical protein